MVHERPVDGIHRGGLIKRARGFAPFDEANGLAYAAAQVVIHHQAGSLLKSARSLGACWKCSRVNGLTISQRAPMRDGTVRLSVRGQ